MAKHKSLKDKIRQVSHRVVASVAIASALLTGSAFAAGGVGWTGSNGPGSTVFTSNTFWVTDDNIGSAADNGAVARAIQSEGVRLGSTSAREAHARAQIDVALTKARGDCETEYAARGGQGSADCRIWGVGFTATTAGPGVTAPEYNNDASAQATTAQWMSAWNNETNNGMRQYTHDGAAYSINSDIDSANTLASFANQGMSAPNTDLIVIVLAKDQPVLNYHLSVETRSAATMLSTKEATAVRDHIVTSNNGSSIVENVDLNVILHFDGNGQTRATSQTKTFSMTNNGQADSPEFTPTDFGWNTWAKGSYWFDIQVAKQGKMAEAVDTPDRIEEESFNVLDPDKQVLGNPTEDGALSYADINTMSVLPNQKVTYKIGVDANIPDNAKEKLTRFGVSDSYDSKVTVDKNSVTVVDNRHGARIIPRSAYTIGNDEKTHTLNVMFTNEWIAANLTDGYNANGEAWLTLTFTATVKADVVDGSHVENIAYEIVNDNKIVTDKVTNSIPPFTPHKTAEDSKGLAINGKNVFKGDVINYKLTMDATPNNMAYLVHKLGMVDDFDETNLTVDPAKVTVVDETGADKTNMFNITVEGGKLYVFAKLIDHTNSEGDMIKAVQPKSLAEYANAPIISLKDAIIDQSLLGHTYTITMPSVVSKDFDGEIINSALENFENLIKNTEVVYNPTKVLNPAKDVTVEVGGESIDNGTVKLDTMFNYMLKSSQLPKNRAYPEVTEWTITDTFDKKIDEITGQWVIIAPVDITVNGKSVFKKGDIIAKSAMVADPTLVSQPMEQRIVPVDGKDAYFTAEWNNDTYTLVIKATDKFLKIASDDTIDNMSWNAYVQAHRIMPVENHPNTFTERINGVDRPSNTVHTSTPEHPAIDLEKYNTADGLENGDRDSMGQALQIGNNADGSMSDVDMSFKITNTGDVPLVDVQLTDSTIDGTGSVEDITYPDGWNHTLEVGESIIVTGKLRNIQAGTSHTDNAKVTGKSKYTGKEVSDEDPFNARRDVLPLAHTGVDVVSVAVCMVVMAGVAVALRLRPNTVRKH